MTAPYLRVGRVYDCGRRGLAECVRVNFSRATMRPLQGRERVIPADPSIGREERRFTERKRFDISPTAALREVTR